MSATYKAWNGQSYPWPPPEGWYEASDGRWWAPGYGPETEDQETVLNQSGGLSAAIDAAATKAPAAESSEATDEPAVKTTTAAATGPVTADTEPSYTAESSRASLIAAGAMMVVLLGGGIGFLAVRDNNSTSAVLPTTTTMALEEPASTTAPPQSTAVAEQVTTTAAFEPSIATSSTAPATTPPESVTTVAPPTTVPPTTSPQTTLPPTSAANPGTIVLPDGPFATDAERAAAWRDVLTQAGIASDAVSDADVIAFGDQFCLFASVSDDGAEFDSEYRDRALSAIAGELTESELNLAIDAAVLIFCSEEAERLGISL